jgi:tRNA 2-thiouridine synthesizing protein C
MMKSLAIINSSAPYGNSNYRESLDMLLANASYDRPVGLFFEGDGVFQLLKETNAMLTGNKDVTKTYGLLELYDIEDVFVCQQSLNARHLTSHQLCIDVKVLDTPQWFSTLSTYNQAMSF